MNKKEYQKIIQTMTELATLDAKQRKLNKILSITEDTQLKKFPIASITTLENAYVAAVSRKAGNDKTHRVNTAVSPYKELYSYCESCLASIEPQWQILAKQHGWKP